MSKKTVLSTQDEWESVRPRFRNASAYRKFAADYAFNPRSRISRSGKATDVVLPKAKPGGWRWKIFEQAMSEGSTVQQVNERAQAICKDASGKPQRDADLFIALFNGYVSLLPPIDGGTRGPQAGS